MSSSQLHQPLNGQSNQNLSSNPLQMSPISKKNEGGLGNGYAEKNNNQPFPNNMPNNMQPSPINAQNLGGKPYIETNGQTSQQKPNTPATQNNKTTSSSLVSERNCKLFVMYFLSCLISISGFVVSLILFIKASDLFGSNFDKAFAFPDNFDTKFNFALIYNPLSGLTFMLCIYLMHQSSYNNGRNINYSQTLTLIISMLAFIFGVVNYTQKKVDIQTCSASTSLCEYLNILSAYFQMVIPVSLIPFLLLAGTQYILYRLKSTPPSQNPTQSKDLEMQGKNQQINDQNKAAIESDMNKKNQLGGQSINGNGPITDKANQGSYQNSRPSMLKTDQKLGDLKPGHNQFNNPGINQNNNIGINQNNGPINSINNMNSGNQDPISFQNPVQKFNNQASMNGRSDSIVNNFGVPMYQQPKNNQIELEYKQVNTPRENMYQGLNNGNMNLSQTPTPNLGANSAMKLSQNPFDKFDDGQDYQQQIKTSVSQFTNTPIKSPTKGISPIDRVALTSTQGKSPDNISDQIGNTEYNPFGKTEKGEIQIGKHPYIIGAKDPYIGQILDQVQAMVNSQVKSLLIDLKKQNKY